MCVDRCLDPQKEAAMSIPGGAVAGIVSGVLVVMLLLVIAAVLLVRRRRILATKRSRYSK